MGGAATEREGESWIEDDGAPDEVRATGLFERGYAAARRRGLPDEDAREFGAKLVESLLRVTHADLWRRMGIEERRAYLHTCEEHGLTTLQLAIRRRLAHEQAWPGAGADGEDWEPAAKGSGPEHQMEARQAMVAVDVAIDRLSPRRREIWVRHEDGDETITDIAASMNLKKRAVQQALYIARLQIAATLKRLGWSQEDLCDALEDSSD